MDTLTTPPGAAAPLGTDGLDEQPAPPSDFSRFLAHARSRRAVPVAAGRDVPDWADWADPDPAAVAALPAHRRPVARLLARRGGRPRSRATMKTVLAQLCRL